MFYTFVRDTLLLYSNQVKHLLSLLFYMGQ